MPEGQRESAGTLNPIAMMNLDLTIGYENLVLFAQAGMAKTRFLQKHSLTSSAFLQNTFALKAGFYKVFFAKVCHITNPLKIQRRY